MCCLLPIEANEDIYRPVQCNVLRIVCRTGRVSGAINRDLTVRVSDSTRTTSSVSIRGTTTSDNDSFAYKVRQLQHSIHRRATERHLPCGITQCSPATRHRWTRPALTPAKQAGTRFIGYLPRRDGRLSWPWCWWYTEMVYLSAESHPS